MNKRPASDGFTDEELIDEPTMRARRGGVSAAALAQQVKRGDLPKPLQTHPKRWLRADASHWGRTITPIDAVQKMRDAVKELARSMPPGAQGHPPSRRSRKGSQAPSADQARLEVCRIARALADQVARLVAVPAAHSLTQVDEEHLVDALKQTTSLVEQVQDSAVAYFVARGWDPAWIAKALNQDAKDVRRRLKAAHRPSPLPPLERRELDHWLTRYDIAVADRGQDWSLADGPPSVGLSRISIYDELRQLEERAAGLDAEPPSPAKASEQFQVHARRAELYGQVAEITNNEAKRTSSEALKAMREAFLAAKEAWKDHHHARPSPTTG
ncbi:hypothetical protein [Nonomuraea sp. NPDC049141]|uniref:hypothetical protein n=1 Tax=Nonomuraea sp. NPDC049141 TaxID=3155500 RepID=UPI0033E914E1